jgi:fibronectin-binding autotransporter adhesin
MTTRTLDGIYATTYQLASPITRLTIGAGGYLGGGLEAVGTGHYTIVNNGGVKGAAYGIELAGKSTVTNTGTIRSETGEGVYLEMGGSVVNGSTGDPLALITGLDAITATGSAATVTNLGTLWGSTIGVSLLDAGVITNGAASRTGALISGDTAIKATKATVNNFGTVAGAASRGGVGIYLIDGGLVTNGSASDTHALVSAYAVGLAALEAAATLTNYGVVRAVGTASAGVALGYGGLVVNGSTVVTSAIIEGAEGVAAEDLTTVRNFGTIRSAGGADYLFPVGVLLKSGGTVINGSTSVTTATIDGVYAVVVQTAPGTVVNYGHIGDVSAAAGVGMTYGGSVTNGADGDIGALIQGSAGVFFRGGPGTMHNFGTVMAYGASLISSGVVTYVGGVVVNGDAADLAATLHGQTGVYDKADLATVVNYGTITGGAAGVLLAAGGRVTNGDAADDSAFIQGETGATLGGDIGGTIANYGTIVGAVIGGDGVLVTGTSTRAGVLVNGGGADTIARIQGYIGAAGSYAKILNAGTIAGNGAAKSIGVGLDVYSSLVNGSATDAAAMVTACTGVTLAAHGSLTNFGTVQGTGGVAVVLDDPTDRIVAENGSRFIGQVQAGMGSVSVDGAVTMGGLVSSGTVSEFDADIVLAVGGVTEAGKATQVNDDSSGLAYAGVFTQSAGAVVVAPGDSLDFTGSGDRFSGTLGGSGGIDFSKGTDLLSGATLQTAVVADGAAVTLSGTLTSTAAMSVSSSKMLVATGGATLAGSGGSMLLSAASSRITGVSSAATLTNLTQTIVGEGKLGGGSMVLVNGAAGVIEGDVSTALTIDTGAATISNAGLVEAAAGGRVVIASAVANTGTVEAVGTGILTVQAAVGGAGVARLDGGAIDFQAGFSEAVTFTAGGGKLELARSKNYGGTVEGFSSAATLDLDDIRYAAKTTTVGFSGSAKSGTLTVTDGTTTASITLLGDYTAAGFAVAGDGHGGTLVTEGPGAAPPPGAPATAHAFVSVAASLSVGAIASTIGAAQTHVAPLAQLGLPRLALA